MILSLLKYLKHYIELIKTETSPNIITVRLKKRKVICEQCHIKMHLHYLGRQRKVLIGESSWIVCHLLRYICPRCRKTKTINIPFVKPKARIAEECKEQIVRSLKYRVSINEVAKRYGISHTTVTKLLRSYNTTIDWEEFEGDLRLGIDEHSFRRYEMIISVRELTTRSQLGFIYPDRKEKLKEFLRNLPIKDKIKEISIDMKSSYINSVREELPYARIVLDHFHVVQDANREVLRVIEVENFVSKGKLPRKIFYKGIERLKDKEKRGSVKKLK